MIDQIVLSWAVKKALDIIFNSIKNSITNNKPKIIYITPELGFSYKIVNSNLILIPIESTAYSIGPTAIELSVSDYCETQSELVNKLNNRLENSLNHFIDKRLDSK
jgi:hypothetical protein